MPTSIDRNSNLTVAAAAQRMRERDLTGLLVTRSDGTLVGLLRREDAEAADGHSR